MSIHLFLFALLFCVISLQMSGVFIHLQNSALAMLLNNSIIFNFHQIFFICFKWKIFLINVSKLKKSTALTTHVSTHNYTHRSTQRNTDKQKYTDNIHRQYLWKIHKGIWGLAGDFSYIHSLMVYDHRIYNKLMQRDFLMCLPFSGQSRLFHSKQ